MLKKIIDFLSAPVVNLVVGLVFYLLLAYCMLVYDSFDLGSGLITALFVISVDIFSYGFKGVWDLCRSKKSSGQDLDD